MTLTLDPRTEQSLQRELARGHHADASKLIAHGLRLVAAQEEWLQHSRSEINDHIAESLAQAKRGEVYTAEEAARLLDERIANHRQ